MVEKRLLVPERVRRPPAEGFSWVDRRFMRDHAEGLSQDAILLYFFLTAVSDKDGLSFWSDVKTGGRLKLGPAAVGCARAELVRRGLLAYSAPLTQVLAIPEPRTRSREPGAGGPPFPIGDVLRQLRRGSP
jgi:hypothetical protein